MDDITRHYQSCDIFGLPSPGENIEYEDYDGSNEELEEEFSDSVL